MKVCDKCRKEIRPWSRMKKKDCSAAHRIQIGDAHDGGRARMFEMDLCSRCKGNLMQNIRRWLKRPQHEKPEQP